MIVLGIDAGGTKTVCQLADETGLVLAEARGSGANLVSLGEAGVEAVLRSVIDQVTVGRPGAPAVVCLGMAGVDQAKEQNVIRRLVSRIRQFDRVLIVSDSLIALEAGAPDGPGVVVASGTGSIAYGRDARGRAARAGGWGFVLADEGSGFWIGKEALRAVMRAADRRGPTTALTAQVLGHYQVRRPRDLARQVYNGGVKPSLIAELAKPVQDAAESGDAVALDILERAAAELGLLAASVAERLDLAEGPFVLAGGTFRAAPRVATALTTRLTTRLPRAVTRLLDVEPAYGAVRLALAMMRGRLRVPVYLD
jgi:N-acetylglucosamine kinase-like BadF-type ATPase